MPSVAATRVDIERQRVVVASLANVCGGTVKVMQGNFWHGLRPDFAVSKKR